MAEYRPPSLKKDETRLVSYDKLSRGKKQEIDNDRRAALAKAKKDNAEPTGEGFVRGYYALNPVVPEKIRNDTLRNIDENRASRAARIKSAQDDAEYKDVKSGRDIKFGDDAAHKFKAGGKVRGTGCAARGHGKGTMR